MAQDALFGVSWQTMLSDSARIAVAYLLALPIGWNREKEHTAGIRTFPIVSIAACGFVMLGSAATVYTPDSYSRLLQGLITGIGFIGGGAILKDKDKESVMGTATAASIWNIAIVGASVGLGLYHIAVVLTIINILTLRLLTPVKHEMDNNSRGDSQKPKD